MELSHPIIEKLVNALIASGPGGILSIVFFLYWRMDRDKVIDVTKDFKDVIQENTKAITTNSEVIRQLKDSICRYKE